MGGEPAQDQPAAGGVYRGLGRAGQHEADPQGGCSAGGGHQWRANRAARSGRGSPRRARCRGRHRGLSCHSCGRSDRHQHGLPGRAPTARRTARRDREVRISASCASERPLPEWSAARARSTSRPGPRTVSPRHRPRVTEQAAALRPGGASVSRAAPRRVAIGRRREPGRPLLRPPPYRPEHTASGQERTVRRVRCPIVKSPSPVHAPVLSGLRRQAAPSAGTPWSRRCGRRFRRRRPGVRPRAPGRSPGRWTTRGRRPP